MFLPLAAVTIVHLPLLAGREVTMRVVVVEAIPQASAVSEFTPVVITFPGGLQVTDKGRDHHLINLVKNQF